MSFTFLFVLQIEIFTFDTCELTSFFAKKVILSKSVRDNHIVVGLVEPDFWIRFFPDPDFEVKL